MPAPRRRRPSWESAGRPWARGESPRWEETPPVPRLPHPSPPRPAWRRAKRGTSKMAAGWAAAGGVSHGGGEAAARPRLDGRKRRLPPAAAGGAARRQGRPRGRLTRTEQGEAHNGSGATCFHFPRAKSGLAFLPRGEKTSFSGPLIANGTFFLVPMQAFHGIQQQHCCNRRRHIRIKHIPRFQQSPTT